MIDRFEEILRELGIEYAEPLHLDKHGACKLFINETLHVQLESRPEYDAIVAATFLGEITPGKFRENLLKAALKTNYLYPESAVLSYSERNNQLALFQFIPITSLTGKKLSDYLLGFAKKAGEWRSRLETGDLSNLAPPSSSSGRGMFGLTP